MIFIKCSCAFEPHHRQRNVPGYSGAPPRCSPRCETSAMPSYISINWPKNVVKAPLIDTPSGTLVKANPRVIQFCSCGAEPLQRNQGSRPHRKDSQWISPGPEVLDDLQANSSRPVSAPGNRRNFTRFLHRKAPIREP